MNLLVVSLTKSSMASRSVTRCEATVLLPRVSYSAIETRCKPQQQVASYVVDHVFGDQGELARLPH